MEKNPDPDPRDASGLEPGGQVPPGETPPAEGGLSGAGPEETPHNPTKGWAKGPVIVLGIVVLCFVIFFVAYAFLV